MNNSRETIKRLKKAQKVMTTQDSIVLTGYKIIGLELKNKEIIALFAMGSYLDQKHKNQLREYQRKLLKPGCGI